MFAKNPISAGKTTLITKNGTKHAYSFAPAERGVAHPFISTVASLAKTYILFCQAEMTTILTLCSVIEMVEVKDGVFQT